MNFQLTKDCKCLVATPVSHLPKVIKFINLNKNVFKVEENANKLELLKLFKNDERLKYVFINPNAQGYKLDEEILGNINIKGINTCSTGTNHIDLDYLYFLKEDLFDLDVILILFL